jgi:ribosome-associated protein
MKTLPGQSKTHTSDAQAHKEKNLDGQKSVANLLKLSIQALEDAKAEDIVTLELDGKTAIADAMLVVSGRSNRHVASIADKLEEVLKAAGYRDLRIEGQQHCDWVLVDAGDVIIHIFRPEVRVFYNLEKLWSPDAPEDQPV